MKQNRGIRSVSRVVATVKREVNDVNDGITMWIRKVERKSKYFYALY
jgi:hypothetical protein